MGNENTIYKKAKGRRLQQWVRDLLIEKLEVSRGYRKSFYGCWW